MQILKHNFYIILKTQLLIGKSLRRSILLALYGCDFGKKALIKVRFERTRTTATMHSTTHRLKEEKVQN